MSMQRLATELEETARQTAVLVEGIHQALLILADQDANPETARQNAMAKIVDALQGQDRIEQRCHGLAAAVRQMDTKGAAAPDQNFDTIWSGLTLDELRVPALSGVAAHLNSGEAELF
ncbi:hypothetical protein PSQ19_11840 [Devosia algicola]|uniref:Uncharacterized protein n=1 Tax=Devosia algicola TaxID=3026418 RepID=A0ABY7YJL9_9HYPH|nr:hypothetical protein [Devosia algicola]WDR01490.1 hypothetical protein PSQ19_11840 [Devosia algicola]